MKLTTVLLFIMLRLPASAQNPYYCGNRYADDWWCDHPNPNQPNCAVCYWTDPVYGSESCEVGCYQQPPGSHLASMKLQKPTALTGLPDLSVNLTGPLDAPIVGNGSDRGIFGYTLVLTDEGGPSAYAMPRIHERAHNVPDIAPGKSEQYVATVQPVRQDGTSLAIQSAALDSVIFSDGEFAGPDKASTFKVISIQVEAARAFALKALADHGLVALIAETNRAKVLAGRAREVLGMGSTMEEIQASQMTNTLAEELYQIKEDLGSEAMDQAIDRLSKLPKLWRK